MAGLVLQPADDRTEELSRLSRQLLGDLRAMNAQVVPLRCADAR